MMNKINIKGKYMKIKGKLKNSKFKNNVGKTTFYYCATRQCERHWRVFLLKRRHFCLPIN